MFENIFVERLWHTVKYERIYRHDSTSGPEQHPALSEYFDFYNPSGAGLSDTERTVSGERRLRAMGSVAKVLRLTVSVPKGEPPPGCSCGQP